jgi:hypothetical protein
MVEKEGVGGVASTISLGSGCSLDRADHEKGRSPSIYSSAREEVAALARGKIIEQVLAWAAGLPADKMK